MNIFALVQTSLSYDSREYNFLQYWHI